MDPREESDWYEPDMWWQQQDEELSRLDNWDFTEKETDHESGQSEL